MSPTAHLLITTIFFFILKLFFYLNYAVLFIALILTLLIDVFDHSVLILLAQNPVAKHIRKLFFSGKVLEAYNFYYNTRRENASFTFLHNLLFFSAAIILTVLSRSYVLFLGVVLHLSCDFFYEFYKYHKLHDVWTFNLLKK